MNTKNALGWAWHQLKKAFDLTEGMIVKGGAILLAFATPIQGYLILTGVLVIADMFTGWRANKRRTGAKFSSKGMGTTIEKTLLYVIAILICRGFDIVFGMDGTFGTTYVVAGLITGRELLSNLENISTVTGLDLATFIKEKIEGLFKKKEA